MLQRSYKMRKKKKSYKSVNSWQRIQDTTKSNRFYCEKQDNLSKQKKSQIVSYKIILKFCLSLSLSLSLSLYVLLLFSAGCSCYGLGPPFPFLFLSLGFSVCSSQSFVDSRSSLPLSLSLILSLILSLPVIFVLQACWRSRRYQAY